MLIAIGVMLILNPKIETIHAVTVVPIFAPIITPVDSNGVSKPAFTKLTTITVVVDEDWVIEVTPKPVSNPRNRLVVIPLRMDRRREPATFCNPSLKIFIPKMKIPKAPISCKKSKKEYAIYRLSLTYFKQIYKIRNICETLN